jgi:cyanophycinase
MRLIPGFALVFAFTCLSCARGQNESHDKRHGSLVVCGGGLAEGLSDRLTRVLQGGGLQSPISQKFVELAGGPDANFVIIQLPNRRDPQDNRPLAERIRSAADPESAAEFGVKNMTALHFSDRDAAQSKDFVAPLHQANAVWITGGDLEKLAKSGTNTELHRELKAVLDRGGVIGGESAGAMILAAQITSNIPPSPEPNVDLVAGFGFLEGTAIVPHLHTKGLQESLVPVVAAHPNLLGLGIDDGMAVVVQGGFLDIIGNGKVAVYDNADHNGTHYYFLSAGDRFDLTKREKKQEADLRPTNEKQSNPGN